MSNDVKKVQREAGPLVLALIAPYPVFFLVIWFVQQVMIAPRYGQEVANIFGAHAFILITASWLLNGLKNMVLRRLGYFVD